MSPSQNPLRASTEDAKVYGRAGRAICRGVAGPGGMLQWAGVTPFSVCPPVGIHCIDAAAGQRLSPGLDNACVRVCSEPGTLRLCSASASASFVQPLGRCGTHAGTKMRVPHGDRTSYVGARAAYKYVPCSGGLASRCERSLLSDHFVGAMTPQSVAAVRTPTLCHPHQRLPSPARYPCGLMQGDDKAKATVDAMISGLLKDVSKYSLEKGVASSVLANRKDLVRQVCGVCVRQGGTVSCSTPASESGPWGCCRVALGVSALSEKNGRKFPLRTRCTFSLWRP